MRVRDTGAIANQRNLLDRLIDDAGPKWEPL
jgi:hypothetical protein